jgi:hypothetical protein
MLYRLSLDSESGDDLQALPYMNMQQVNRIEKDLENLLANHLSETLYHHTSLMPFFQERSWQKEADLYALDADGNVIVFELKRGDAGGEAVHQVLRYTQTAGQWTYADLNKQYEKYRPKDARELRDAHREEFALDEPLRKGQFNQKQTMHVIGNAADRALVEAVEYWQSQGLDIHFSPYRIYELGGEHFFEFFARPNDRRVNPGDRKGVVFDTNRSYDEDAIWMMMEKSRVSAFGGSKNQADALNRGDLVFYSHKGHGIIAAARVVSETRKTGDEWYHDVEFLTPRPERGGALPRMSFSDLQDVADQRFFWARTAKTPYLDYNVAEQVLTALQEHLGMASQS